MRDLNKLTTHASCPHCGASGLHAISLTRKGARTIASAVCKTCSFARGDEVERQGPDTLENLCKTLVVPFVTVTLIKSSIEIPKRKFRQLRIGRKKPRARVINNHAKKSPCHANSRLFLFTHASPPPTRRSTGLAFGDPASSMLAL